MDGCDSKWCRIIVVQDDGAKFTYNLTQTGKVVEKLRRQKRRDLKKMTGSYVLLRQYLSHITEQTEINSTETPPENTSCFGSNVNNDENMINGDLQFQVHDGLIHVPSGFPFKNLENVLDQEISNTEDNHRHRTLENAESDWYDQTSIEWLLSRPLNVK
ncbi:hypothetical protein TRFO_30859 [Tritrichomonas foetus]|uniref:Uncharacterized protein n=1 Tax=Tritrichomonas foetus TaxID=1144522 RepID=A0A1J4JTS1_9EUKA|nr:hypothetical protein TRFO_30859 [Tritrichomonas foetus]|eukprot:OHT02154.1 hypothetical protein TRFO_30859 [Tritrichomonas foetus]